MKNKWIIMLSLIIIAGIMITSCKKDSTDIVIKKTNPTVNLKTGSGYTSATVTIKYNDKAKIGFNATSNGVDSIVSVKIMNADAVVLDSTMNANKFYKEYTITKDLTTLQKITFTITDKGGRTAKTSIDLKRVNTFNSYTNKILGAQDTLQIGGFLAAETGTIYKFSEVKANLSKINVFCYHDAAGDNMSLASPGSGITGISPYSDSLSLDTWTPKNLCYFVKLTSVTAAQFDGLQNDELLITAFSGTANKVTDIVVGDIIGFKTFPTSSTNHKYGMIKITDVSPGPKGYIKFDYKIQK